MAEVRDDTLMPPGHVRIERFLLQSPHSQMHDGFGRLLDLGSRKLR
jgi:hypothetical protein